MDIDMVSDGFQDSSRPGSPATTDSSVIALDGDPRLVKSELRDDSSEQTHKSPSPARPPSAAPSASAPAPITKSATAAAKPVSTAKPRSSKPKARSPSRSPPPPPPPAPIQTIRLDIGLGGPDNYAVDIADLARASGQRPLTPTNATTTAHSDSEDDDDKGTDREKGTDKDKKKKKKKNPTFEHYDISDPFIDDSELAIDERTYFAQTKQQGFYVSSGEVALLKDKSPKKPKSKNPLSVAASSKKGLSIPLSAVKNDAVVDHGAAAPGVSMSVSDDEKGPSTHAADEKVGEKRKRYITVVEGGKKRKVVDVRSFHPLIQQEIQTLREHVAKENWEQKGKFPPSIKPLLSKLALLAIKLDEYDEFFFSLMPTIFPYNKFTMSKLIKRTVYSEHQELLQERQNALLADLAAQAKAGFQKAQEEWEKSVVAWDKRREKLALEGTTDPANGTDSGGPTRHPTEEMDVDPSPSAHPSVKDGGGDKEKEGKDKDHLSQPPGKKYRLTESMKAIVWQLVLLSNESCRLENEKNTLEGSVIQVSEQGSRKALYQKIVAAFPEGWLSSGQISRDVSAMKKRFEREAMEQENEQEY